MVAGVIEAVMSPLMVRWEKMKKVTTQQVTTSRVCAHIIVCVCPGMRSLYLDVLWLNLGKTPDERPGASGYLGYSHLIIYLVLCNMLCVCAFCMQYNVNFLLLCYLQRDMDL